MDGAHDEDDDDDDQITLSIPTQSHLPKSSVHSHHRQVPFIFFVQPALIGTKRRCSSDSDSFLIRLSTGHSKLYYHVIITAGRSNSS